MARPAPAGRAVVVGAATIARYAGVGKQHRGRRDAPPSCRTCSGIHRAACAQASEVASPRHRSAATGSRSAAVIALPEIDGRPAPRPAVEFAQRRGGAERGRIAIGASPSHPCRAKSAPRAGHPAIARRHAPCRNRLFLAVPFDDRRLVRVTDRPLLVERRGRAWRRLMPKHPRGLRPGGATASPARPAPNAEPPRPTATSLRLRANTLLPGAPPQSR